MMMVMNANSVKLIIFNFILIFFHLLCIFTFTVTRIVLDTICSQGQSSVSSVHYIFMCVCVGGGVCKSYVIQHLWP